MWKISKSPFVDCFYIKIFNSSPSYGLYFNIQYMFRGKIKELKSSILGYDEEDRLCIPLTASNIKLKVTIVTGVSSKLILNKFILSNTDYCLITSGTFNHPSLGEIPCN